MLKFRGSSNFRQRIAHATVSGRAIRIDDIRANSESPGLRDFEACFLRLIEKVTNGCVVEINETGAQLPDWRPLLPRYGSPMALL